MRVRALSAPFLARGARFSRSRPAPIVRSVAGIAANWWRRRYRRGGVAALAPLALLALLAPLALLALLAPLAPLALLALLVLLPLLPLLVRG